MKSALSLMLLSLFSFAISIEAEAQDKRPNILWTTIEDWSPELSCYGTKAKEPTRMTTISLKDSKSNANKANSRTKAQEMVF